MNIPGKWVMMIVLVLVPLWGYGQLFISDTNFSGVVGSGARAFGMGGAFIAVADDATAASWNPGGLGQLERPELSFVIRHQNYRRVEPAYSDLETFIGPQDMNGSTYGFDFLSFTFPLRIGKFKIVPQISYQRAINYHMDTETNKVFNTFTRYIEELQSTVEYQGFFTQNDSFTGGIDFISVSLGSRFFDRINIGFSANFWRNGFKGEENLVSTGVLNRLPDSTFLTDYRYEEYGLISVDVSAFNFNIGVLFEVLDNLKIGAVFKSKATADVDYKATARFLESSAALGTRKIEAQESDTSTMTWPQTWGVGISYRPIDTLTLSLDFTETQWSRSILKDFRHRGDDFAEIIEEDLYFPSFVPVNNQAGFKQLDTQQIRFGLEYILIGQKIFFPFRCGFFTDSQFFSDASGEKITFIGVTGGFGIKKGGLAVDLAVLYETGNFLQTNFNFTVTQFTDLKLYLSTSYSF